MKKLISLLIAICLFSGVLAASIYIYHRSHKVWIPVDDENTTQEVILQAEQACYKTNTVVLLFNLENKSTDMIYFGATTYDSVKLQSYEDKESNISLQKKVDGKWCCWGIPKEYQNTNNVSIAEVAAEVPAGGTCNFIVHSLQYLDKLDAGYYRAVLPILILREPGANQSYDVYAEFSVV